MVAITHVTVVDLTTNPSTAAALRLEYTVVVSGQRIAAIGPSGEVAIPGGARVMDASGKYLIPGLWDMHVHLTGAGEPSGSREFLVPLLLANGVTGVRDMGGYLDALFALRDEISSGKRMGPRIVFSGPYLDGPKPSFQPSIPLSNAPAARLAVDSLHERGVDFIKVQSLLPREAYFAVAGEARRLHSPFAGHVPDTVSAAEASDAGQRSIEHLTNILLGCSNLKTDLQWQESGLNVPEGESPKAEHEREWGQMLLRDFDSGKADALFALLAHNRTWQTPTLILLRNVGLATADEKLSHDPRLIFVPRAVRENWARSRKNRLTGRTPEDFALRRALLEKQIELTGAMRRAGVEFLAGTDTAAPHVFPGSSLHEELELLVQAGFTPAEALSSATVNPVRYLGMSGSLGTVEQGKLADLVILDANPLEDIRNTRKIAAVIVDGKLLDRNDLNRLLARTADLAK